MPPAGPRSTAADPGSPSARPGGRADHLHAPDWAVLTLVCLAQFMVVLDVSIVNVALPSIRQELHFSATGLQWVVNAYTLAFAGFLLLGGRAADLFGRRRVFLSGLALFTLASLLGGFAPDRGTLIAARILQGLGGAVLSPATLTILTTTFPEGPRRARALGLWSAVAGAGGAAGALLGGVLTDLVNWRWILFVNVPIGVLTAVAARALFVESRQDRSDRQLDLPGAVLVTGGLMTLVFAIVNTDSHGWLSRQTLATLTLSVLLLSGFLVREGRFARAPLMPLRLFRLRAVSSANAVMALVSAAVFASWYFLSLYMQGVLHYSPLITGLAFLPQTVMIVVGAQLSSRLIGRLGARRILLGAPLISAVGLFLLGRTGPHGAFLSTLLVPSMLVTLGVGLAFTPLALTATAGVPRADAGLASGLINTARQVGGSLGLAALAALATSRTAAALAHPGSMAHSELARVALTAGYTRAFTAGALIAVAAAAVALTLPRHPGAGTPGPGASPTEERALPVLID